MELFGAGDGLIRDDEHRAVFVSLEQLLPLRVELVRAISMHRLLRHVALVRTLRSLMITLCCESDRHRPLTAASRRTRTAPICAIC